MSSHLGIDAVGEIALIDERPEIECCIIGEQEEDPRRKELVVPIVYLQLDS